MICWDRYRAEGYIDGLKGADNHRMSYPPECRSFYDIGRIDGEAARAAIAKAEGRL